MITLMNINMIIILMIRDYQININNYAHNGIAFVIVDVILCNAAILFLIIPTSNFSAINNYIL